jgi:glucose/arabinose dehydrogenase
VGRTIGALGLLALAAPLLASSCASSESKQPGDTAGVGGTGQTGGQGTTGGAGSGGTSGGTGPAAGTSGSSAGGQSGAGGATSGSAGTVAGGGTTGGGGSGAEGGTPPATGGNAGGGQAGDAGSGGTPAGGSGGTGGNWWFSGPRTPPPLGTWPPPAIKLTEVVDGDLEQPTAIAAPRADTTRLYVAEKWGRIRLIKDGALLPTPALDIRMAVLEGGPQAGDELLHQGKRGLVGMAFHPNFETNGRLFVLYVADQGTPGVYGTSSNQWDDGDMTIEEYRRNASNPDIFDPTPVQQIVQFDKGNCNTCNQHNGGSLEIDVDGFLWASTGDPPPYEDPGSQHLMNLNGKLLRYDISGDTVMPAGNYPNADAAISSIGIRNAYKFSFDRYTGDAFVADVGESTREEVTVERYGQRNKNHGWPMFEGTLNPGEPCASCLAPVFEYGHTGDEGAPGADNCIVGGYVYRGQAIPGLQGAYVYGDNGSAAVRAIQVQDGAMTSQGAADLLPKGSVFMGCFGEDAAGELYVCDYNNTKILRVDAQ